MSFLKRILEKPEYIFRPMQILKRLSYRRVAKVKQTQTINLPWGVPIEVNLHEVIGKSIFLFGVYDLSLTESIKRIVKKGDVVFDVGANIGYISGLASFLVGKEGIVHCFEPHPMIGNKLKDNLRRTSDQLGYDNVIAHHVALSSSVGKSNLFVPNFFSENEGTSSLEERSDSSKITILTDTLDHFASPDTVINLMKVDVEGHEANVFKGAARALSQRRIRHIIFENDSHPEVFEMLKGFGYVIFKINKTFKGVVLTDIADARYKISYEADNFLATLFPSEIEKAFEKKGWTIYQ